MIMAGRNIGTSRAIRSPATSTEAGAEPAKAPTRAEDCGAGDQWRVDGRAGRQVEYLGTQGRQLALPDQPVAHECRQRCAAHHECEAGVPRPEDVEEVQNLGRIGHPRNDEPQAKRRDPARNPAKLRIEWLLKSRGERKWSSKRRRWQRRLPHDRQSR